MTKLVLFDPLTEVFLQFIPRPKEMLPRIIVDELALSTQSLGWVSFLLTAVAFFNVIRDNVDHNVQCFDAPNLPT